MQGKEKARDKKDSSLGAWLQSFAPHSGRDSGVSRSPTFWGQGSEDRILGGCPSHVLQDLLYRGRRGASGQHHAFLGLGAHFVGGARANWGSTLGLALPPRELLCTRYGPAPKSLFCLAFPPPGTSEFGSTSTPICSRKTLLPFSAQRTQTAAAASASCLSGTTFLNFRSAPESLLAKPLPRLKEP